MTTITISTLNARNARPSARQRARRRVKVFRQVCGTLAFLAFFFTLGTVGSVECGTVALLPGTLRMFAGIGACWLLAWLAGAFR